MVNIGNLIYDKKGNIHLPNIPDAPLPSDHFNLEPNVIHHHVFQRHTEEVFHQAVTEANSMLSTVPGFHLISRKPHYHFKRTQYGLLHCYQMELLYFIDPDFDENTKKRNIFSRLFHH